MERDPDQGVIYAPWERGFNRLHFHVGVKPQLLLAQRHLGQDLTSLPFRPLHRGLGLDLGRLPPEQPGTNWVSSAKLNGCFEADGPLRTRPGRTSQSAKLAPSGPSEDL